jgi:hypothetical protein
MQDSTRSAHVLRGMALGDLGNSEQALEQLWAKGLAAR